jgi:hypothetical protein
LVAPGQLPINKWWVVNWNKLRRREKCKLKQDWVSYLVKTSSKWGYVTSIRGLVCKEGFNAGCGMKLTIEV